MKRSIHSILTRSGCVVGMIVLLVLTGYLPAQDVPFTGVVVEEKVPVRAGAGRAYYIVGELKKGDVVQVEDVLFGWNKIVCPPGVYSYISKAFVNAKGDGRTGVVSSDAVEVKAGSINGPGQSYRGQLTLDKGDMVEIIGQDGSYYKIVPPSNAYVFIRPGSVRRDESLQQKPTETQPQPVVPTPETVIEREPEPEPVAEPVPVPEAVTTAGKADDDSRVTAQKPPVEEYVIEDEPLPQEPQSADAAEEAERTTRQADEKMDVEPEKLADDEDPAVVVSDQVIEETVVTHPVVEEQATEPQVAYSEPVVVVLDGGKGVEFVSVADSEALQELEKKTLPLLELPLDRQPLDDMIASYEQIKTRDDLSSVDRQIVQMRIAAMKHNMELARALKRLESRAEKEQPSPLEEIETPRVSFDAVGRLLASSVYNGESLPRMFRLVDAAGKRTIAYIKPGDPVDTVKMLGRLVGVVGSQQYDPALKLQVFEIEKIKVLSINE